MPQANQDRLRQRAQAGPQQLFPQQLQKAVPGSLQDWELRLQEEALRERLGGANPPAAGLPPGAAGLPPGAAEIQEALRAIAANNPMNPGTLPEIPALNQELQRILGGMQPPPASPASRSRPGGVASAVEDMQRRMAEIAPPSPQPPPGGFASAVEDMQRRMEAMGGTYSPPVPSMSYPWDKPASIMPQGPPNLPGTGTAMVPPMPSAPPPAPSASFRRGGQANQGRLRQRAQAQQAPGGSLQVPGIPLGQSISYASAAGYPQYKMAQAPAAPPSRPQPWRPQGQRPAPATVGQTTTNPALQDRQRGGQSMARPAPQRGGLGIGGLGMESAGPQRQGTGFMSGDVAWTTPQRPSGPSYYEGLMPGSTYSPMEQQRRR